MASSSPPQGKSSRMLIWICFAIVYAVWGSTFLGVRVGVESLPPFLMGAVRYSIAGSVLLAVLLSLGAKFPNRIEVREGIVNGAFLVFISNGATVWVADKIPSGYAALLWATVPFWMIVLQWVMPGMSRPSLRSMGGALIGFVGMFVLVQPDAAISADPASLAQSVGVVTLGALAWSTGSLRSTRKSDESPMMRAALQMTAGGLMMFVPSFLLGEMQPGLWSHVTVRSWVALGYLITFGSIVVGSAYLYLLSHVPASKVATYAYVNPVVAVILGALLMNEPITAKTVLGGAIILGALTLALSPSSRKVEALAKVSA
jgi:drug/metabolite transporter (DMT)-like permease